MLYFMPLGTGVSKRKPQSWRHTGRSTPHGDFWCCQGTGIEAFARLAEHVFMTSTRLPADPSHNPPAAPELFVLQLIPATLQWRARQLRLELESQARGAPLQGGWDELQHEELGRRRRVVARVGREVGTRHEDVFR